jgi:CRP-like cAMP-binding protein
MFALERKYLHTLGVSFTITTICQFTDLPVRHRSQKAESVPASRFTNTLLRVLQPQAVTRLGLRPVDLELKHEIEYPGRPIKYLYFLESGMASMTNTFSDGSQVEVGMFGYESVIGVSALMGTKKSLNRIYMQIAGHGYYCPVESAMKEFQLNGGFHAVCLRYVQAQLDQAAQSAGCNAKHKFEPRLARWLLLCSDRAHSETFRMSHDLLADMLGGTRATVSIAAGVLKKKGLIQYSRGVIKILDREGLINNACECYKIIKQHLKNYAEFDLPITE